MSEQQLHALSRHRESDVFDEREKLVLDLVVAMAATPCDVSAALFDALRERFSEPALVELVAAIAYENFRARFNRPFDVEAAGYSEGAWCPLPQR